MNALNRIAALRELLFYDQRWKRKIIYFERHGTIIVELLHDCAIFSHALAQ